MSVSYTSLFFFFFNDTATTEIYTLSLHDALPISEFHMIIWRRRGSASKLEWNTLRSEEHTSELQSLIDLVCRLLLEKKRNSILAAANLLLLEKTAGCKCNLQWRTQFWRMRGLDHWKQRADSECDYRCFFFKIPGATQYYTFSPEHRPSI